MKLLTCKRRNVNFPMSRLSSMCVFVCVVVYARRPLPNGFIYCSLNGIFHHDEIPCYLFISFKTANINIRAGCARARVRRKSLEVPKATCVYFNFCNKKNSERRKEKPYSKTPLCSRNHFAVFYVSVCACVYVRYQIKFFA